MSKIFYDHLIILEEVEVELDNLELEGEEREELEHLIEELVHHRVLDRILSHLPRHHHIEFLDKFHEAPHDEALLEYLDEKISEACRKQGLTVEDSVEEHIKDEMEKLKKEILKDIKSSKRTK